MLRIRRPLSSLVTAVAASVAIATTLSAQTTGTYTLYGSGCNGSGGTNSGPVIPAGYANQWGGRGNAFPWGYFNQHYMQVHEKTDLPVTTLVRGLAFRNRQNFAQNAYVLDITVRVGFSVNNPQTTSATFASNWAGTPQVGFTGKLNVPAAAASNTPSRFTLNVPFTAPFVYSQARGHFAWETINTTGSQPNTNFFDAATGLSTQVTRIYAVGSGAASGSLGRGYGVVTQILGSSSGAIVKLANTGVPTINQSFSVDVSGAVTNSVAILWLGAQQLNVSLAPTLPGCTLYSSLDVLLGGVATGSTGNASMRFTLPNARNLVGIQFYNQWMVVDSAANALGVVLSNGGAAKIGG